MEFEYDEAKNQTNIKKHGISFRSAARVFFDYDRIELYDEENSVEEDRYDTIGDTSAGSLVYGNSTVIGNIYQSSDKVNDILFVVYTERRYTRNDGRTVEATRLISARMATNFERGLYYGKYE
ncbi:MAG: BrnT family toxin [Clostridia bacterium]|nr:BrnT family toxin [Clostridia bacterium]